MGKYGDMLGAISPSAMGVRHAADVVAALTPPTRSGTEIAKADEPTPSVSRSVLALVPGVLGAGVGALTWKKHRVLGAVAGHAVASTALPIIRGGADRKRALCQLGVEGAAVVGSLMWEEHPILGFCAGLLTGAAASALVPGSAANDMWRKWRKESK